MPKKSCAIIINPKSGLGITWIKRVLNTYFNFPLPEMSHLNTKDIVKKIKETLEKKNINLIFMYTKHKGHATTLTKKAIKQQVNIIIGVGGDGTINEIINGMSKTTIPLGIIPSGTANVLSLETCGPSSLKKLSRSIRIIKTSSFKKSKNNS